MTGIRGATARHRALVLEERRDLVVFLGSLTADDEHHPTPCGGWTVRDVVAHLVAWDDLLVHRSLVTHLVAGARWGVASTAARMRRTELDAVLPKPSASLPFASLVARFGAQVDASSRWLFDGVAPGGQLAEYVVHHEDVRRAVDRPRQVPPERLQVALDGVSRLPAVGAKARLGQARWVATDLDWSAGRGGSEVRLPAQSLLLALAGRDTAAPSLG